MTERWGWLYLSVGFGEDLSRSWEMMTEESPDVRKRDVKDASTETSTPKGAAGTKRAGTEAKRRRKADVIFGLYESPITGQNSIRSQPSERKQRRASAKDAFVSGAKDTARSVQCTSGTLAK